MKSPTSRAVSAKKFSRPSSRSPSPPISSRNNEVISSPAPASPSTKSERGRSAKVSRPASRGRGPNSPASSSGARTPNLRKDGSNPALFNKIDDGPSAILILDHVNEDTADETSSIASSQSSIKTMKMIKRSRRTSIFHMNQDEAVLRIQVLIRKFLAERRVKKRKVMTFREKYQSQFDTMDKLRKFTIMTHGAAIKIQQWFRNKWWWRNKRRWRKKYAKMIARYKSQRKLYPAIIRWKLHNYNFNDQDFYDIEKYRFASALVINRVVRGFLGRRRFKHCKDKVDAERKLIMNSVLCLQAFFRRMLVIKRNPEIGFRHRLFEQKKRRCLQEALYIDEDAIKFFPADFAFKTRRASAIYPHLKLGPDLDALNAKVLIIHRNFRRHHATRTFRRLVLERNIRNICKIQAWYRRQRIINKIFRCLDLINPIWQTKVKQRRAAIVIQSKFRTYSRRKWLKKILNIRRFCSTKIIKWVRYRYRVKQVHREVIKRRLKLELQRSGTKLYANTELRWLTFYMWQGLKKTSDTKIDKIPHELQKIFSAHSLNGGIDLTKIVKFCKDCNPTLINNKEGFSVNTIELQFTRIKSTSDKRINYAKFLDLLANFALIRFFKLDPPRNVWDSPNLTFTAPVNATYCGEEMKDSEVNAENLHYYRYGSLQGKAAFVVRFILTFFKTWTDFQRCVELMGSKSAEGLSATTLSSSVGTIQTFMKNRIAILKLTRDLRVLRTQKEFRKQTRAAIKIEAIVRGFNARHRCMKMAQQMYSKFIDGVTDRPYWSNQRTGMSFWVKPFLLLDQDCGLPVRMPSPLEVYTVYCSQCNDIYATCYCEQCKTTYCTMCYASGHASGQRKQHTPFVIDTCIQCEFQIGTCKCFTCQDLFCDSCYKYMHKKGRLRFHTYERYGYVCQRCGSLAAQWREFLNDAQSGVAVGGAHVGLTERLWCGVCFHDEYNKTPRETVTGNKRSQAGLLGSNRVEKVKYYGRALYEYQEQLKKKAKEEEIRNVFLRRQEELIKQNRIKAATTIQRVYRGHVGRSEMKAFIDERKKFFELRRAEDAKRASIWYILQSLFGSPPLLESDTPLERVKKLYPWYMHHIVAACIENKWSDACRLMTEHDEYMKHCAKKNAGLLEKWSAKWQLRKAKKNIAYIEEQLEQKDALVETAAKSYYEAQVSGAVSEAKLKQMKKGLNKLEKEKQKVMDKKAKYEEKLANAQEHVVKCYGPRRLTKLIEERRKTGLLLPFRVKLVRHCRQAQVVQWITTNPNDPLDPNNPNPYPVPKKGGNLGGEGAGDGTLVDEDMGDGEFYYSFDENGQPMLVDNNGIGAGGNNYDDPNNLLDGSSAGMMMLPSGIPEEGEWKKFLKTGDKIYLQGHKFSICPSAVAKKKLQKKSESRPGSGTTSGDGSSKNSSGRPSTANSQHSDGESSQGGDGKSSKGDGKSSKSHRRSYYQQDSDEEDEKEKAKERERQAKLSEIPDLDNIDMETGGLSRRSSSKSTVDQQVDTTYLIPADMEMEVKVDDVTLDHITLDRPWLYDDIEIIEVFKVMPRVFYTRPIIGLKDLTIKAYPTQKITAILAITMHKISRLMDRLAGFFDEESNQRVRLGNVSIKAMRAKYFWLSFSYSIVQMSYDFTLRRSFAKILYAFFKVFSSAVKTVYNLYKTLTTSTKETPFEYWSRSLEKEEVLCFYSLSPDNVIALGELKMDLKAPLEIIREYFHRNFREKLNETVGESFLFMKLDPDNNIDLILPRDDEFRTPAKDYNVVKTDSKTFISQPSITICKDRDRGRVFIPEYVELKNDEDSQVSLEKDDLEIDDLT